MTDRAPARACRPPDRLRVAARVATIALAAVARHHPEWATEAPAPEPLPPPVVLRRSARTMAAKKLKKGEALAASPKPSAAQVKRVSDDVLAQLEGSADAPAVPGGPEGVHAALFGGAGKGAGKLKAIVKAIVPGLLEGAMMAADGALSPAEIARVIAIVKFAAREIAAIRAGGVTPDAPGPAPAA